MTGFLSASAPGKLVLTGEYAVLEGATAVSAATDARARVTITAAEAANHELVVVNTGQCFRFRDGFTAAPEWLDDAANYGDVVNAALARIRVDAKLSFSGSLSITIDTREFYTASPTPEKKGMGSSGAVVVALTGALYDWFGLEADLATAIEIHRSFQGSKGSGVDVVTSSYGGVIAFTPGREPRVQRLKHPHGLQMQPVWTGHSASTPSMLTRLQKFQLAEPETYKNMLGALCLSANLAASSWQKSDRQQLLKTINDYAVSLQALDAEMAVGIWSKSHCELRELAIAAGVIYKPSGAGGGDYGIAFAADVEHLNGFKRAVSEAGYSDPAPGWSSDGLQISR